MLWFFSALLAQSLVFLYPPVIVFWLIIHTNIDYWRSAGKKRAYWTACMAWPLIGIPLFYFRGRLFEDRLPVRGWAIVLGVTALILAARTAYLAAQMISWRTLIGLAELEPERLRQPILDTAIYSRMRNPVYFAHWLTLFAAAALSGYVVNWILFMGDTVAVQLMIRAEEKELLRRYGREFESYMRKVPRFFPW
jgi:protein-S-isoprenylcysteine O-methyltransferase Ste14